MRTILNATDSPPQAPVLGGLATVLGTGLTALDRIYASGLNRPLEALGGSCGNVLVSLAMLGHHVAPVVALGADAHGDFLFDEFRRAGCRTDWVLRKGDRHSPVIIEHVDVSQARHRFSFNCPETHRDLPRWRTIDEDQVRSARQALEGVSVFYADRLSTAIVTAMEAAHDSGGLVVFEPASNDEQNLLARALRSVSILKLSDETVGPARGGFASPPSSGVVVIRTHGGDGLTASYCGIDRFFDMVTTGLLDHLLRHWAGRSDWTAEDIFEGVEAGQRLASVNCAFAGARGVFHALGPQRVRSGLESGFETNFLAEAMSFGPYDGY
jgi:fructokinase